MGKHDVDDGVAISVGGITLTRREQKLIANRVLSEVASEVGRKKRWVARQYRRNNPTIVSRVNARTTSICNEEYPGIDPDNFRAILEVILEFLMALFAMFI
jgi:hypothetical protein